MRHPPHLLHVLQKPTHGPVPFCQLSEGKGCQGIAVCQAQDGVGGAPAQGRVSV